MSVCEVDIDDTVTLGCTMRRRTSFQQPRRAPPIPDKTPKRRPQTELHRFVSLSSGAPRAGTARIPERPGTVWASLDW
ncbi:hypothetical protein CGMCC3_g9076 [Colletotrichum fructicola]|nr:uncharacterized protein CGMCC3_g9076 [Colletotrichum fructicola]KAE9574949.1 hypothetical protein CGMCC3_g9076 [Colletotrichum fructicola]